MEDLREFRERLTPLITRCEERPFLCDGCPLAATVFVVGFNPATTLDRPFWSYWSDESGFDRNAFMADYLRLRKLKGARPRIEAIVQQLPRGAVLETNICSLPTRRAADLRPGDRRTEVFRFLLRTIQPAIVFAHSNQPIAFLQELTGVRSVDGLPHSAQWREVSFDLVGRPGPLWRASLEEARSVGQRISAVLAALRPSASR